MLTLPLDQSIDGRRILVTGASRGIGRALAIHLAEHGAVVGVNYLRSESHVRELEEMFPGIQPLPFDVRQPAEVAKGVAQFTSMNGGIDALVNNAGVPQTGLLVLSRNDDVLRDTIETNLWGTIVCSRAVLPVMWKQRSGIILNISSVAADLPVVGQSVYAATKGGVESFTRALATECAQNGIRVNCVRLGPIDTDMLRNNAERGTYENKTLACRLGTPLEVAAFLAFHLSDSCAFMTGAVVPFDGGYGRR